MTSLLPQRFADGYTYLEAPRWHDERLWVSDFFTNRVLTFDLDGKEHEVAAVDGMPAGLGFLPGGTPIVVSQSGRRLHRIVNGELELHADLAGVVTGPANDMVVAVDGTAYVGNHGFDMSSGAAPQPAALARVSPQGDVSVAADGLIFPNGSAITDDGTTLLVAESFAHRITAFTIDPDGTLSARRTWAQLDEELTPDGICLDAEGCVWAGNPLAGRFVRLREGGELMDQIETPGRWSVACVFGGPDRRTLFLLTAETSMEDQLRGVSRAFIDTVVPDVPGAGIP
jgi:sugar lactone lactonase YvrE